MLKTILKIFLVIIVLACLAAADIWFVWSRNYPLWVAGAIFAGILGLFIGLLFLRKYLVRRREKKFVQKIVKLDESVIKGAPLNERRELQDLQDNWKQSLDLLKHSTLRRHGNPLYALPWYLVIGESGSGKTTAIRNARLESPLAYPDRASTISATINCEWWFFQNAVVLDTAGRYTIPLNEMTDREEWEKFLSLLAKYRRLEPINGIIATIAADKILAANANILREDGQNIRKRIDQLMRVVGARFPIYILVTKMDRVYGFNDIFGNLSAEDMSQAMGYLNKSAKSHHDAFLEEAFDSVSERVLQIALNSIRAKEATRAGTLVFREEFMRLKPGLIEFMNSVFGDNPYQEMPLLRGVFFSSGRQEENCTSEFLSVAGVSPASGTPPIERGIFLKDIFSRVLTSDRYLYTHTRDFLQWRRITKSLGFTSWLFIWLSLIGLLTFSFIHNTTILGHFTDIFGKSPVVSGNTVQNLLMIEKLRIEIENLEMDNSRWFIPSMGLTQANEAEKRAKDRYVVAVNQGFLSKFDKDSTAKLNLAGSATEPEIIAIWANYLVMRTGLVGESLDKGKISDSKHFGDAAAAVIDLNYDHFPYETARLFGAIYKDYLLWHNSKPELVQSRELLEAGLVGLVARHGSLKWLVRKTMPDAPDVKLTEFWGSPDMGEYHDTVFVPGSYTKLGRKHITDFIAYLENVLQAGAPILAKVPGFWRWYQEEYYKAWYAFADNFDEGADAFQTEAARRNLAALMVTDQNPYWKLIERLSAETIQTDQKAKPPKWTGLPAELINIAKLASSGSDQDKKNVTLQEKISREFKKAELSAQKKLTVIDPKAAKLAEERPSRAKIYTEYLKNLARLAPVTSSGDTALRMISDLFLGQAAIEEDKSPFNQAFTQYTALKTMMKKDDYGNAEFLWSVLVGPLNFLMDFGVGKASCSLQERWEGDVLGKVEGVPEEKILKSLFDNPDGVVTKFRDVTAKPFLAVTKLGISPRKAFKSTSLEYSIAFRPRFLRFLNAATTSPAEFHSDHTVNITTVPIDVNTDTKTRPIGNTLSLQCTDGTATLQNYNYPVSHPFVWSPDKCGDTVLDIKFPDFTLTKVYKGKIGFAKFLAEFSSGARSFGLADFPENKADILRTRVSSIHIRYKIDGAQSVLAALKKSSEKVPSIAVICPFR